MLSEEEAVLFHFRVPHYEATDFGKVAVLYGGRSAERVISLESGQAVLQALRAHKIDAYGLDSADDAFVSKLIKGKFNRAFIVLHGAEGEDGSIQGLLQYLGIPYTGSGVGASALGMDKVRSKWIWQAQGLATPAFGLARSLQDAFSLAQDLGFPLAIKPVSQGSSLGVFKVNQQSELAEAYTKAAAYGQVMLESWVEGTEYTVGIIKDRTLETIKITAEEEFYDYNAKYHAPTTRFECPCGLAPIEEQSMRIMALRAYKALDCKGWGRIDIMRDKLGKAWLLEVNTIPGMTSHSLVPLAAKSMGISFEDLVVSILESTLIVETVQV
jgi:D-alanine-D-alanine ligase